MLSILHLTKLHYMCIRGSMHAGLLHVQSCMCPVLGPLDLSVLIWSLLRAGSLTKLVYYDYRAIIFLELCRDIIELLAILLSYIATV